jgi:hypothetical protein
VAHTHTHTHTHTHAHTHTHTHAHTHTNTHTQTHTHTHRMCSSECFAKRWIRWQHALLGVCVCVWVCILLSLHQFVDTCLQIQDEFLHIHTAYTQLHIHTHVYLHIQACACCTNICIHACIIQYPNMHTHACTRQITCTYEYICGAAQMYM